MLWRSYENSWEQIFSAGVGAPGKNIMALDVVTQLGYGQRISWNDVIDAGATLRWKNDLMTVTENTTYTLNSI